MRYNLLRENPHGYARLFLLLRNIQYAAIAEPSYFTRMNGVQATKGNELLLSSLTQLERGAQEALHNAGIAHQRLPFSFSPLTVDELVEQAHAHCGTENLDLGRVASIFTETVSELLSLTNYPLETWLCERRRTGTMSKHSSDLPIHYGDNGLRRALGGLLKFAKRALPVSRIIQMLMFKNQHETRQKIMRLEEALKTFQEELDTAEKIEKIAEENLKKCEKEMQTFSRQETEDMRRINMSYDHRGARDMNSKVLYHVNLFINNKLRSCFLIHTIVPNQFTASDSQSRHG